jgi:hypothetical protein
MLIKFITGGGGSVSVQYNPYFRKISKSLFLLFPKMDFVFFLKRADTLQETAYSKAVSV